MRMSHSRGKFLDVIIFEMMGSEESTLIFHSPIADKIRRIIKGIGKRHGLRGERQMFFNDDCSPFLLELSENELPAMRLNAFAHLRRDTSSGPRRKGWSDISLCGMLYVAGMCIETIKRMHR